MLIYLAYAFVLLILMGAGVIAWHNSRLIAQQSDRTIPRPAKSSYTVVVTRQFSEEEQKSLVPLFQVFFQEGDGTTSAYLCRVSGDRGELKLAAAVDIFNHKLSDIIARGTMQSVKPVYEAADSPDETEMIKQLENRVQKEQGYAAAVETTEGGS